MTKTQQLAFVRCLYEMANADGQVVRSESNIIMEVLKWWNFTTDDLNRALSIDIQSAATQLKTLNESEKIQLGMLLGKISVADGRICNNENQFFNWLDSQLGLSKLMD
ncbi:MAG: TerB family tellurite resistance protein [Prevotellaceae bacterium]|nr:TerB family tellurite resistance protein [Candidatus Minthosoma equi]